MSTYTVTLNGAAPWGFRLQGGKDFNMPLTISRITPGSKAAGGSLAQGDIISSIDGVSTDGMTHLEAQNKIKSANSKLALTMLKSRRLGPVPTATPRMDSPMPVIPHQKDKNPSEWDYPKKDPDLLLTPVKAPASSTAAAGSPQSQRGQYNCPIGLYSPETVKEMMLMQGKLGEGPAPALGVPLFGTVMRKRTQNFSVALPAFIPLTCGTIPGAYTQTYLAYIQVIANTAAGLEYTPSFNPIALKDSALSTHKPIEVRGPGGKATIVHAQYNTPISMYSQDAIMDAIAGQSQAKGHEGEEAGSPLSGVLPLKDPVVDCASPVYQAVIRPGEMNQDMAEWARRAANLQSKSFRMLAHITGTEYLQDPDEEALQRSRDKFESEVKGPRFAKLKNWHNGLSAQILNVQE